MQVVYSQHDMACAGHVSGPWWLAFPGMPDHGAGPLDTPRSVSRAAWVLALLTFIGGIVFPILPILGVQLGLAGYLIGLILAANRIMRLVANPLTGLLVDRIGGKVPLTLGLLVEACATAAYSVALHTTRPAWCSSWDGVCGASVRRS